MWGKWKRFGFPHAGGWAEQIAKVFDVIEAVESEYGEIEARRVEKARGNS